MDRLFVTDLDGTLLRSDRSLSPYTVRELNSALAAGVPLTYATARSLHSAEPLVAAVAFSLPVIVFDGAMVAEPRSGRVLRKAHLDLDVTAGVLDASRRRGLRPMAFGFDGGREVARYSPPVNAAERRWEAGRRRVGDGRLQRVAEVTAPEVPLLVQCIAPLPEATALLADLRAGFAGRITAGLIHDVYMPEYYQLQVHHPEANKGAALRWLADYLGIAHQAVTVFGDNDNDLAMFAVAGRRLAVANAEAHVRAAADAVLGICDEDAVARHMAALRAGTAT